MKTLLYLKHLYVLLFLTLSLQSFVTSISIQKYPGVIRMKLKRNSVSIFKICLTFMMIKNDYIKIIDNYFTEFYKKLYLKTRKF